MASRAQAIFDSTMQRTSMKWGKAAKLAAGAAVVFAMREQGRGDRTHYVAVRSSFFVSSSHGPPSMASFRTASPILDAYGYDLTLLQHGLLLV